jgi:hypothetical protein
MKDEDGVELQVWIQRLCRTKSVNPKIVWFYPYMACFFI